MIGDPAAILFDLDDTIVMDDVVGKDCWRAACGAYADRIGLGSPEDLYAVIRRASHVFWGDPERNRLGRLDLLETRRRVVEEALAGAGFTDRSVARALADTYSREKDERARLFPGALQTLDALRDRGTPMALLTNGSEVLQAAKIDRFGLRGYFACIVIEGAFGCGKPDERVFRHALSALGVPPRGAMMVGDRLGWDIEPAQRLGLTGVWVDAAGAGLPADAPVQPDHTVRSICELL